MMHPILFQHSFITIRTSYLFWTLSIVVFMFMTRYRGVNKYGLDHDRVTDAILWTFFGAAGGALFDMGVYHIGQILYLLDNPKVLRITGKTYQETPIDPRRLEISNYDVEELGMGFVRLENNIALDIIEAWAIHLDGFEGSYIVGSQGGVKLEPFGYYFNVGDLAINGTGDLGQFDYRLHNVHEIGDVYDSSQHHWIAALQGRVELLPTAAVALNTMLISEGIFLSERLDREVTADEVLAMSQSTAVKL